MKKFISMVMAAAMVVSLVPATAFAKNEASFKVVDAVKLTKDEAKVNPVVGGPQVQMVLGDVDQSTANKYETFDITMDFDGAEFNLATSDKDVVLGDNTGVFRSSVTGAQNDEAKVGIITLKAWEKDDTSLNFTITENGENLKAGDLVVIDLANWKLTSTSAGHVATVAVSGDFGESDDMTFASVLGQGLDLTISGKPVEVAQEEPTALKKITIEPSVSKFAGEEIKVKVSKGFEFVDVTKADIKGATLVSGSIDAGEFKITADDAAKEITITGLKIEATSAKPGDVATITVSAKNLDSDSDEAAVVIADAVIMEVDEDADVPVFYNGVNAKDAGLTSDDDHKALEVTIKESVADAWDGVKAWNLDLPEGVYVTDVKVNTEKGISAAKADSLKDTFAKAYKDGDYEDFDFSRRVVTLDKTQKSELSFELTLVAEPTFTGDVKMVLSGDAFDDDQEVVIAKFVAPYTVDAKSNDMIIDYKETVVPTPVVITEAEEGLWNDTEATDNPVAKFDMNVEDIRVEGSDITVDDESGMDIKVKDATFTVKEASDDAPAVVTMDNVKLYMNRTIPAGAYDLELNTSMYDEFLAQKVLTATDAAVKDVADVLNKDLDDFNTYAVKEGFVNVITSGRDKDDASFTTKVVVPVGESYLIANEQTVALDVPAYINANGYTMLPVRAVAVALGIDTNNVLWNQPTKTVTILYGQRIITMTAGQKVVNVNGSALPATAAVEIVNGRTFLGMRDLATALGVTDITWDAATQTATLNGNK